MRPPPFAGGGSVRPEQAAITSPTSDALIEPRHRFRFIVCTAVVRAGTTVMDAGALYGVKRGWAGFAERGDDTFVGGPNLSLHMFGRRFCPRLRGRVLDRGRSWWFLAVTRLGADATAGMSAAVSVPSHTCSVRCWVVMYPPAGSPRTSLGSAGAERGRWGTPAPLAACWVVSFCLAPRSGIVAVVAKASCM